MRLDVTSIGLFVIRSSTCVRRWCERLASPSGYDVLECPYVVVGSDVLECPYVVY